MLPKASGAELSSWDAQEQRCEVCGAGEECRGEACSACTACQAGFYKPGAGAAACEPCAADAFANASGAEACQLCPRKASTRNRTAATSEAHCICQQDHYAAVRNASLVLPSVQARGLECVACPVGGVCGASGVCMLREMPAGRGSCEGRGLLGEWAVDNRTGEWTLQKCPPGYDLLQLSKLQQECKLRATPEPRQHSSWSPRVAISVGVGVGVGVLVLVGLSVWYLRREWRLQRDALASLRRHAQGHHQSAKLLLPPADAIELARQGDERAQTIIQSMFPRHIAEAMMRGEEHYKEDRSESCAVFFSDIVGFTDISSSLSAAQVCCLCPSHSPTCFSRANACSSCFATPLFQVIQT